MPSKPCNGSERRRALAMFFGVWVALSGSTQTHAQTDARVPRFDPSLLTRENFYQQLEPVAKAEGKLVLYNFAGNFDPIWKNGLIPAFEARYGIKVTYQNVRRDQANQQLIAVHKARQPSPVDVYFAGGPDNFQPLKTAGAISPIKLSTLLPNLAAVPTQYKDVVFGVDTGGTWPLVHRSQLVLAYDSAALPAAQMPTNFEALLTWAEKNPRQLAITSPAMGGSGSGFLYSAALHLTTDPTCQKALRDASAPHEQIVRWATDARCLDPLWTYLSRLLKASELTNGNADTLNLLNNKQVRIGTTWEDLMLTFVRSKQLPETMRAGLLGSGLVSGGDGLFVAAGARHPAAALLFIDMAMGREFQAWKFEHHASRPVRSDVGLGDVSPATARYLARLDAGTAPTISANWGVTRALAQVFDDKVLNKR